MNSFVPLKKILFIDPFIRVPENSCFNHLCELFHWQGFLWQSPYVRSDDLSLPKKIDGCIVFGSSSHVYENLVWQRPLAKFMIELCEQQIPMLGLCFAHQLLAAHFGAQVDYMYPDKRKMLGARKINWDGQEYLLGVSHRQVVKTLPKGFMAPKGQELEFDLLVHEKYPLVTSQAHPEADHFFLTGTSHIKEKVLIDHVLVDGENFIRYWAEKYLR